jgi:hypothetical protein
VRSVKNFGTAVTTLTGTEHPVGLGPNARPEDSAVGEYGRSAPIAVWSVRTCRVENN